MRIGLLRVALALPLMTLALPTPGAAQWGPPGWRYAAAESSLRIRVTPPDAGVYVDGYYAGTVAEFDGQFERLRVVPGEHEVVVYLAGYRSLRQQLYLGPNSTRTIEGTLARLAPGDPEETEPQPNPDARVQEPYDPGPGPAAPPRPPVARRPGEPPAPRTAPPPPDAPIPPPPPEPGVPAGAQGRMPPPSPDAQPPVTSRYGVLSFTVEPRGATIVVDGQKYEGPDGSERVLVQVEEGRHLIEVQRRGYESYERSIEVGRGQTVPVSVALKRR